MSLRRLGDLEIDEDLKFTRRLWTFERAGWIALALFIAAGLLGLMGGPLSEASAASPGGALRVDYERFARLGTPCDFRVRLKLPPGSQGLGRLWLDRSYLSQLKILKITPEPTASRSDSDRTTYAFLGGGEGQELRIVFDVTFRRAGRIRARLGSSDDEAVEFRHFVYP